MDEQKQLAANYTQENSKVIVREICSYALSIIVWGPMLYVVTLQWDWIKLILTAAWIFIPLIGLLFYYCQRERYCRYHELYCGVADLFLGGGAYLVSVDLLCGGLGWPLPIVAPVLAGAGIVLVYRDLAGCERDLKRGELQRLDDPKRKMSVLVRVTYVLAVGGVATQIMLKKMLGINGLIVLAYFVWVWLYIIDVKTAFQLFYKYRLRRKYDLPLLRPAEAAQVELKVQS